MNEFLETFGQIPLSKIIVVAVALIFAYKVLKEGYALLIAFYEKKQSENDKTNRVCDLQSQVEKIGAGVVALLHFRLYAECERIITAGYCTTDEWEDLEHLYKSYEALGGNGTGKILYQKAREVFIKSTKRGN